MQTRTTIQIKPVAFHTWEASYVIFQVTSLAPNNYAIFHYEIWSAQDGLLKQGDLRMEGDDYQSWNADDPFLNEWVLAQLQLEGAPVPEPKPLEPVPVVPVTTTPAVFPWAPQVTVPTPQL